MLRTRRILAPAPATTPPIPRALATVPPAPSAASLARRVVQRRDGMEDNDHPLVRQQTRPVDSEQEDAAAPPAHLSPTAPRGGRSSCPSYRCDQ